MVLGLKLVNPDRHIDCTGLFCPMPIVKTREAMTEMVVGEVLEMLSDDPASEADMRSWSRNTGHELLEVGRSGAIYHFVVRKTR
jgi:tRNA 2-thiouridine synthesizing protein A